MQLPVQYLSSVMMLHFAGRKPVDTTLTNRLAIVPIERIQMNYQVDFAPIAALDLNPIKVKLMHKESGEGWSLAYAEAVEFEYRRFLYLVKKFPNEQAAPLFDVDVFWHYHILDTMKYAADCEAVFGYFLHHFPYVGLRGDEDLEAHHRVGERMRELYEHTFGDEDLEAHHRVGERMRELYEHTFGDEYIRPESSWSISTGNGSVSARPNMVAFSIGMPPGIDTSDVDTQGRVAAAMFYSHRPSISHMA
jgi:hypothetical protein